MGDVILILVQNIPQQKFLSLGTLWELFLHILWLLIYIKNLIEKLIIIIHLNPQDQEILLLQNTLIVFQLMLGELYIIMIWFLIYHLQPWNIIIQTLKFGIIKIGLHMKYVHRQNR